MRIILLMGAAAGWTITASAGEPISLANVEPPPAYSADEPAAGQFSLKQAAAYLDQTALDWQKTHACAACHTMLPYMIARPALSAISPQAPEIRQFFEDIAAGQRDAMPNYTCKDVAAAVAIGVPWALVLNDRGTTGRLHPLTRRALDRMWTFQRPDGSWEWPFRDTPPFKLREHYGVTLAAVAAGMAPDDYAQTPAAAKGLEGIRGFLRNTPPVGLHQQSMLLWASVYVPDLLSADSRAEILASLLATQRPDGGWALASLVDNTNNPALELEPRTTGARSQAGYGQDFLLYVGPEKVYRSSLASDGYATGLVIYVARQAGVPATDPRLARGVGWLKANQRASGRWFTPSQAWHTKHLISNAGTSYAVLALQACGEIP